MPDLPAPAHAECRLDITAGAHEAPAFVGVNRRAAVTVARRHGSDGGLQGQTIPLDATPGSRSTRSSFTGWELRR